MPLTIRVSFYYSVWLLWPYPEVSQERFLTTKVRDRLLLRNYGAMFASDVFIPPPINPVKMGVTFIFQVSRTELELEVD